MARTFADETVETSNTTGTGTYNLEGAKGDYLPFSSTFTTGDQPAYGVRNNNNTKWELNRGAAFTAGSPDILARGVWKSTNGNAPVSWTSDDLPLTVYVPASAEVHEGVVTGWLATARHALLRAGGAWWDYTLGIGTTWIEKLYTGSADIEKGRAHLVSGIFVASPRRLWVDLGAASKTLDADDIGKVLQFDCTAAERTATLLASATAKHGYSVDVVAYGSTTNGVTLAPNGSDAINQLRIPPGGRWRLEWDGARSAWRVYPVRVVTPGQLFGLTLSTAGSSATFSVAAGTAADATASDLIRLATAISKTTSAWSVGSAAGGLDTGAIANGTWYHVHLIKRIDTGVVDALVSLSATAPTMPTGYTLSRRICAMKTNGSAQWTSFQQLGDYFFILEVTDFSFSGTSAMTLRTLSVPTGVSLLPLIKGYSSSVNNTGSTILVAPASNSALSRVLGGSSANGNAGGIYIYGGVEIGPSTNTSGQIYVQVSANSNGGNLGTAGWIDRRGRD